MRDERVDVLRFVGLAMIIFAHVNPPATLFQLRNFDVPLMVLVSGMSFALSVRDSDAYQSYVWKRIKRLVFPVWIFLTLYFSALFLFSPSSSDLNARVVVTSYSLTSGIGYVWIIRVFLLVAIVAPFLYRWQKKTKSNATYFSVLAGCMLAYELLRFYSLPYLDEEVARLVSQIVFYIIPFSIIFMVGLRMFAMNRLNLLRLLYASLAVFLLVGSYLFLKTGAFVPTQKLKYPPSIYYFSYALFVASILWAYSQSIFNFIEKIKLRRSVMFVANNSIWIYLWHIPMIKLIDVGFIPKYLMVSLFAIFITYVQVRILNDYVIKRIPNDRTKKNIKAMLTG